MALFRATLGRPEDALRLRQRMLGRCRRQSPSHVQAQAQASSPTSTSISTTTTTTTTTTTSPSPSPATSASASTQPSSPPPATAPSPPQAATLRLATVRLQARAAATSDQSLDDDHDNDSCSSIGLDSAQSPGTAPHPPDSCSTAETTCAFCEDCRCPDYAFFHQEGRRHDASRRQASPAPAERWTPPRHDPNAPDAQGCR